MSQILTDEDFANAKRDISDIDKAVNTESIVDPRWGDDFKSLPMVSKEWDAKTQDAQSTINSWQDAITQITVNDGVPALAVSTANGNNQQAVNDLGGVDYWAARAYQTNNEVRLDDGTVVISTIDNNSNNPNSNMTGWKKKNSADQIFDKSGKTQQEVNDEQAVKNTEQGNLNNKLDSSFANLTDLLSCDPKYLFDGNIYRVGGIRGGLFKWSVSSTKVVNDGTVFAHTSVQNGKFERIYSGIVYAEWFGAENYIVGGSQDSTAAFQKTADFCGIGGSWKFKGLHRITSNVFIPSRQKICGDAGLNSPYRHLTDDPANWQGINTGTGQTGDAIFYDSYVGDALTLGEGAKPENFLLYGKGVTTMGVNTTIGLPLQNWSENTSSGMRYGKFIKPKNVTVAYFKYAFSSVSSPVSSGGSNVTGNYYQKMLDCEVIYCYAAFKFSDAVAYNHKSVNLKVSATTILIESSVELRNMVFIGGSCEGYTAGNLIRTGSDISFIGTYFETFSTTTVPAVFILENYCSLIFRDCLVYLNNCNYFVRDYTATLNSARIVSTGNKFRTGGSNTLAANYIYSITYAVNAFGSISGDAITYKTGNVINYVNGKAVDIKKDDPMLLLI